MDRIEGDWLGWPCGAAAFPEALAETLQPIAELVDRLAADWEATRLPALEMGDRDGLVACLRELGHLGLLAADVASQLGGGDASMAESCRIAEGLGPLGGLSVAYVAHANLAMTPLAGYADAALQAAYLPDLLSGRRIGAYCLTEAGSGSDARAARTRARRDTDGWRLTGAKAWISNGGIADIFIVFAQFETEGTKGFTACVVERDWPGVSVGAEERKLGMHSSSTTTVVFDDVFVPDCNIVGALGDGARVAFGTVNSGRLKIGAIGIGATRSLLRASLAYARERQAFGAPIIMLPAVRDKLATMAARLFALEAAVYRIASSIDAAREHGATRHAALTAHQAEAALIKVLGSETLAYCADEAVQVFGGNGFSEDYPPARAYRDARVQRIYDGTNEVNRGHAVRTLLKRRGGIDLPHGPDDPGNDMRALVDAALTALVVHADIGAIAHEPVADLAITLLEADSAQLRAAHAPSADGLLALATLAVHDAERRALDAALRLPVEVRGRCSDSMARLYAKLAGVDREAALHAAIGAVDLVA